MLLVKNPPTIKRSRFDPWVRKILLEKEMATSSRSLAYKIPWTEETGGLQSMKSQRVRHNWGHTHTSGSSLSHSIYFLSLFSLNLTSSLWIISEDFSCLACLTFSILVSKFTCSLQTAFELCSEFPFLAHVLEFERHRGCTGIWLKISCYYIV